MMSLVQAQQGEPERRDNNIASLFSKNLGTTTYRIRFAVVPFLFQIISAKVVYTREYMRGCMRKRNRYLVDNGSSCFSCRK